MRCLTSELHTDLYCPMSSDWMNFTLHFKDLTEVGPWRTHILLQCFKFHSDGFIRVTGWKKRHLKMHARPLACSIDWIWWGKRQGKKKQTTQAGSMERKISSGALWDQSFPDCRIPWPPKWEWGSTGPSTTPTPRSSSRWPFLRDRELEQIASRLFDHELYPSPTELHSSSSSPPPFTKFQCCVKDYIIPLNQHGIIS